MASERVAIVTGSGSSGPGIGNGRATAVVLARQGYRLVLVDQAAGAAADTVALIAEEVPSVDTIAVVVGDVADDETCRRATAVAIERFGRLDVLVNNVGVFGPVGGVADADPTTWAATMNVNVTSMALMAKHAIPQMAAGGGGAIVNMSSISALAGTGTDALIYSASKGAIIALSRHLASRHGPQGIRVNCVAPGMIDTPMVAGRVDEAARTRMRMACPLRTIGTAWDVAEAVAFLAGDQARWISGVVLPVDGGLMAVVPSTEGPWIDEAIE